MGEKFIGNQLSYFPKPKEGSGLVNFFVDNLSLKFDVPGKKLSG